MATADLLPWIQVNSHISEEFCEVVIKVALGFLPRAPQDLRKFADDVLSSAVPVPGFRSLKRAVDGGAANAARPHVFRKMKQVPVVANAIIYLWAEAQRNTVERLRTAAETDGLHFSGSPAWNDPQSGFLKIDAIPELGTLVQKMAQNDQDKDDLFLAALWLSRTWVQTIEAAPASESAAEREEGLVVSPEEATSRSEQIQDVPQPALVQPVSDDALGSPDSFAELPLSVLGQKTNEIRTAFLEQHALARKESERLHSAIDSGSPAQALNVGANLGKLLSEWNLLSAKIKELVVPAALRLLSEYKRRTDFDADNSAGMELTAISCAQDFGVVQLDRIFTFVQRILDYDREKANVLNELDNTRAQIAQLSTDITTLTSEATPNADLDSQPDTDPGETSLANLKNYTQRAQERKAQLEDQYTQARDRISSLILDIAGRLTAAAVSGEIEVAGQITLDQITAENLALWTASALGEIKKKLEEAVALHLGRFKAKEISQIAAVLQHSWSIDALQALMETLAIQKRDGEMLLLILGAITAHPVSSADGLSLSSSVANSLLRGIDLFSAKTRPFEMLNWMAPDLFHDWSTGDAVSKSKLAIVLLGAQYFEEQQLPTGLLWQFADEWPLGDMPTWSKLWRAVLTEASLPVVTANESDAESRLLDQTRQHARQVLAYEKGSFSRLNSLKSDRHKAMLRLKLMPKMASRLEILAQLDDNLKDCEQSYLGARLLAQLTEEVRTNSALYSEKQIVEDYEAEIGKENISDHDSFHRRTSLRVLVECAQSIVDYGQAMQEFWPKQIQGPLAIKAQQLRNELERHGELVGLGTPVVDHLIKRRSTGLLPRDDSRSSELARQQFASILLSQPAFAIQLPRLVACLTSTRLAYEEALSLLLEDLANPMEAETAALFLLEQESPNQALMLVSQIGLETQIQAQQLQVGKEREISELHTELAKLGGVVEDLANERKLGRWRLIKQYLSQKLAECRTLRETEAREVQDQARQFRRAINELDELAFEKRSGMPADAYRLMEQGLNLSRQAISSVNLLAVVDGYLQELRYRLDHDAWDLEELQAALTQLDRAWQGQIMPVIQETRADKVQELLEQGELRQLGLSPAEITPSEVGTRSDVLRNWMNIRLLPGFFSEDLDLPQRAIIQAFFQSFSDMVMLRHVRNADGTALAGEDPIVYAHQELQYPKTAALDNHCILIALPGNPPSPRHLSQLEHILEEMEWLDFYFVFLFVPGCTAPIYKRLQLLNRFRGLVIIDEAALLSMILAETEIKKPLGVLRSVMLNSRGAETVVVFKVNQLVNTRTSIFVGREPLVDRVASSGDSYVLYGGRRIGKSSVLEAVSSRLTKRGTRAIVHTFEGDKDCSDDASAIRLAKLMEPMLEVSVGGVGDFKPALLQYLEHNHDQNIVLLLDEIDKYIVANPTRHVLIETFRAVSERHSGRFRVVVSGFMSLYDCLQGRGPYTPTSDPWRRMFTDAGPLKNLHPSSAENIAREGFLNILGWKFENRAVPQWIVERTGGHPAFVQKFCEKLQQRVAARNDRLIRIEDVDAVFNDDTPTESFVAYVQDTLYMNLKEDPVGYYVILWLAKEARKTRSFTLDQFRDLAGLSKARITEKRLSRSLERLTVTSVVKERVSGVYEFSVPDYPQILERLGQTSLLNNLEVEIARCMEQDHDDVA